MEGDARRTYGGTDNLEVMQEARNYNSWLVREVLAQMPRTGRVLDFGAGLGFFTRAVRAEGVPAEAVESDSGHIAVLRAAGLPTHSDLEEIADHSVDGVFSLNVLEHIEDDAAALREISRVLRAGASLMIYVPALPSLFTAMDEKVGHVRRYRRQELRRKLEAAGFRVTNIRHVDLLGVPATLAYRIVGSRSGDLNRAAVTAYDRLVFPLSRLLDRSLGGVIGKNLLARAVKS